MLPVFVFVLVFGLDDLGDVCAPDVPQLQRPVVSRLLRLWLYGLVVGVSGEGLALLVSVCAGGCVYGYSSSISSISK